MFLDACDIDDGATLECDVCVIGAGAAGLTIAHELAGSALSVIVISGGGRRRRGRDQALYRGTVRDPSQHSWADRFRERRYGGTTAIWGGRCVPYDAIDFEARPYVPHSGWPFGRDTLEPYYARAAVYCEIGAPLFDAATALPDRPASLLPGLASEAVTGTTIERFSRPTDFGRLLERRLAAAPAVRVLLDAHCIGLAGAANGAAIDHAPCATFRPSRFSVRARTYVVAAGGLETARLLMAARQASAQPLAIASPWLGRGYMGHLNGTVGAIRFAVPPERINGGYEVSPDGVYCRRRLWVTAAAQRQHGLLNTMFRLHHPPIADPTHRDPVLSAMYLVKDLVLYEYSRKLRAARSLGHLLGHLRNVATRPLVLARFGIDFVDRRWLRPRRLPSVARFSPTGRYSIEFHAEQSPDPASRLELGDAVDCFGMPELVIDWRVHARDVDSVARAYALLQRELAAAGLGVLELDRDGMDAAIRADGAVGGHHLGAVRLADAPERGVVDRHGRLFGIANGYVASAAVLPTSSQANPTFTVVALAIRLADHLRQRAHATRLSARPVRLETRPRREPVPA
ncbi:MAG: GMC family oxidoreductase [Proteobacteria bacterium]|nr:GMC family oxidoreductase [Pseudomonadota bacterium]